MKKLILYLVLCVSVIACNDSDDDSVNVGQETVVNKFRVQEISGKNDYWGEFSMHFTYYEDRVDSAVVCNTKRDTIGVLTTAEDEKSRTYYVADLIPSIDPDSIQILEDLYGELAKDSIPMMTRNVFSLKTEYTNSVVTAQDFSYYRPREDVGTGAGFNNKYLNDKRVRYVYEYNAAGALKICRIFYDVYEEDEYDNAEYKRTVYKAVFSYNEDGQVSSIDWYQGDERYQASGSYELADQFQFVYSGGHPVALNGGLSAWQYQCSGDLVSRIDYGGKIMQYGYNGDGYLKHIEDMNGGYMDIKYESGNGNFSLFTPLPERNIYVPYIR